jgi:hypothetical protein
MTTVISVRGIHGKEQTALQLDPTFVYVGRPCAGWLGSKWGNPFKPGMDAIRAMKLLAAIRAPADSIMPYHGDGTLAVADCLKWYQALVEHSGLRAQLPSLRGKRLGCWCGDWEPGGPELLCHAVVLAKLADAAPEARP